jgi:hypothetical protein
LQDHFLVDVVGLSALRCAIRAETQLETNDAFDNRLGVEVYELQQEFVGPFLVVLE